MDLSKEEKAILRVALVAYDSSRRVMFESVKAAVLHPELTKLSGLQHLTDVLTTIQAEIDAAAKLHVRLIQESL